MYLVQQINNIMESSGKFFDLDHTKKIKYERTKGGGFQGYVPMDGEK